MSSLHRLPASYFVTMSYMCWADRRRTLTWRDGETTIE
jgi:fumarate hydratase class I